MVTFVVEAYLSKSHRLLWRATREERRDAYWLALRAEADPRLDVKVVEVRTASVKSKPKRRGQTAGRTRQWKKAIVQVREGDTIPIFRGLEGAE